MYVYVYSDISINILSVYNKYIYIYMYKCVDGEKMMKKIYIYICRYTYIYKKMMNMCLPFSLAFVYGEHIASCAYVSCGQDKRRWILLVRVDVRFVFVIVEVGGQSYRAVIANKYRLLNKYGFCFSFRGIPYADS